MGQPAKQLTPTIRLNYAPQGATLRRFHKRPEWCRNLIGPLGSAKTQTCISELLECIQEAPVDRQTMHIGGKDMLVRRSRWAAVRNTYGDLENTTIKDFSELVCDELGLGEVKMTAPPVWRHQWLRKDGTLVIAEVIFLAMDLPKDEKRARGLQLTGVWFNEMKELAKNNVDMLQGRIGRYPPRSACPDRKKHSLGDSNAPDDDHWLAKLCHQWEDGLLPGWWFGIQPPGVIKKGGKWVMNPECENRNNLDDDYYERQIGGKKESWIQKNLANMFVRHTDGEAVHPDFSETLHVSDYNLQPTPGMTLAIGFDFGRRPAMIVGQQQPNGQILILSEVIGKNVSAEKFRKPAARHLRKNYDTYDITDQTGDPSGDYPGEQVEDSAIEIMNEQDEFEIMPAYTNDFEERTGTLDRLLGELIEGEPAILISPRCKTLVKGLSGNYQFKRVQVAGEERFHSKPVKDDTSHVCEALHYMLMGMGESTGVPSTDDDDYNTENWAPNPEYFE